MDARDNVAVQQANLLVKQLQEVRFQTFQLGLPKNWKMLTFTNQNWQIFPQKLESFDLKKNKSLTLNNEKFWK